jgi:hypothetical protein
MEFDATLPEETIEHVGLAGTDDANEPHGLAQRGDRHGNVQPLPAGPDPDVAKAVDSGR